ncbi:hypothetical protein H9P43_005792 [Blastocladiella emersonii ATCC 22665]|nr:hypothetical protein H9P43_005792 [Blastocladiella emersonii ATCC 22665]
MSSSQIVASLFEKMKNPDADFRYMALNDLMSAVADPNFTLEANSEARLVDAIFTLLRDNNGGVKNMALKCLTPLVRTLRERSLVDVAARLTELLTNKTEDQLRDMACLGLKSVFAELNAADDAPAKLAIKTANRLLELFPGEPAENIQVDILDTVTDLVARFGRAIARQAEGTAFLASLLAKFTAMLGTARPALRKRAGVAVSVLVPLLSPADASKVVASLLGDLAKGRLDADTQRTHIACLSLIIKAPAASAAGGPSSGLAAHLPALVESLAAIVRANEDHDELREAAMQALDALLLRYASAMAPLVDGLIPLALDMVQYDPNYNYDESEETDRIGATTPANDLDDDGASAEPMETDDDEAGDDGDDEDYGDFGGDDDDEYGEGYSDDEDMSWKVRRAAARLLNTVLATRPDLAARLVAEVGPTLTRRFEEREEGVRNEVLGTYATLLRQVAAQGTNSPAATALRPHRAMFHRRWVKYVVASKDVSTRQAGFVVLREALAAFDWSRSRASDTARWVKAVGEAMALGGAGAHHAVAGAAAASATTLKLEALAFVGAWLRVTPAAEVPVLVMDDLTKALLQGMQDKYYKVAAEATVIARDLVPALVAHNAVASVLALEEHAECTLLNTSADEEVKDRTLALFGLVVATAGSALTARQAAWSEVLMKRLTNEVARLAATRVVNQIVNATGVVDVTFLIPALVAEMTGNLRKNPRALREATVVALTSIVAKYAPAVTPAQAQQILDEATALVAEDDLLLASQSLKASATILNHFPALLPVASRGVLPAAFALVRSPLVAGTHTLASLLALLSAASKAAPADPALYQQVQQLPHDQPAVQAKALAAVARASSLDAAAIVNDLTSAVTQKTGDVAARHAALLTLGELGRTSDLSQAGPGLLNLVVEQFRSDNDAIRSAAAYTLGSLAVGGPAAFIPVIVHAIQDPSGGATGHRYLMLHALKQVLTSANDVPALAQYVAPLWQTLFALTGGAGAVQEEGARLLLGECIGKLALLNPAEYIRDLHAKLAAGAAEVRATTLGALKYVFAHATAESDTALAPLLGDFFQRIGDAEVPVRRAALAALQAAAHTRPALVRPVLGATLPLVLRETVVRPELIREVAMGPFKHKIDDGLETRKLAFEALATLTQTCAAHVQPGSVLDAVLAGLRDVHEVQLLAGLALAKLAHAAPLVIAARLDDLVDPFYAALFPKAKANAVKQDVEKAQELVRSALRGVVAVAPVLDAASAPKFAAFLAELRNGPLAKDLAEVEAAVAAQGPLADM